jgi:hypothetical protein
MRVLLYSGLLYILGIAIILALKPNIMFTEDGGWKEFGIGRDPERFTWIPFWLFTVLWAMLSFFTVQTLAVMGVIPGAEWTSIDSSSFSSATKKNTSRTRLPSSNDLKPGYYMLNTEGTAAEGVPKYIYIGSAPTNES